MAGLFEENVMDLADTIRQRVRLVSGAGGQKPYLIHPPNGRFHPIDYDALEAVVQVLAARIPIHAIDVGVGFPEGGSVPTDPFGRAARRPPVPGSRLPV